MRPPASTDSLYGYIAGSRLLVAKETIRGLLPMNGADITRSAPTCSFFISRERAFQFVGISRLDDAKLHTQRAGRNQTVMNYQ